MRRLPGRAARRIARYPRRMLRVVGLGDEVGLLTALIGFALAICLGALIFGAHVVPPGALVVPIAVGVLGLRLVRLRILLVGAALMLALDVGELGINAVRVGSVLAVIAIGVIAVYTVAVREKLGLVGTRGDTMLGELRDRIMSTAVPEDLPPGWHLELTTRSAGGTAFGGDFVVTRRDGHRLELAMVDVSGKGVAAGTRALQLSGALGALLGSLPPEQFLAQANRYLFHLSWEEGFATALHVALRLDTGRYAVATAGHPPAATFDAGSGVWRLLEAEGPALGLLERPDYLSVTGRLDPGDALLIYTDGLVEVAGRDLAVGIDKLLGEANRLVVGGFAGGAGRLLNAVASRSADDRAVLLLWRS